MVFKMCILGCSLVVQRLGLGTFTAVGPGSVPGQGTKILQAMGHGKKKKKLFTNVCLGCCKLHKVRYGYFKMWSWIFNPPPTEWWGSMSSLPEPRWAWIQ